MGDALQSAVCKAELVRSILGEGRSRLERCEKSEVKPTIAVDLWSSSCSLNGESDPQRTGISETDENLL